MQRKSGSCSREAREHSRSYRFRLRRAGPKRLFKSRMAPSESQRARWRRRRRLPASIPRRVQRSGHGRTMRLITTGNSKLRISDPALFCAVLSPVNSRAGRVLVLASELVARDSARCRRMRWRGDQHLGLGGARAASAKPDGFRDRLCPRLLSCYQRLCESRVARSFAEFCRDPSVTVASTVFLSAERRPLPDQNAGSQRNL